MGVGVIVAVGTGVEVEAGTGGKVELEIAVSFVTTFATGVHETKMITTSKNITMFLIFIDFFLYKEMHEYYFDSINGLR